MFFTGSKNKSRYLWGNGSLYQQNNKTKNNKGGSRKERETFEVKEQNEKNYAKLL
jgi:hypothetical protein